jgi:probable F420-dependent oxidoreductase
MVIANDYRHPVTLAREAATIDVLSDGRFELGIGTGWIKPQYDSIGLAYDDPKTRVDRFEEAIDVIKGCWSGQPFTYTGGHYQLEDATCPTPTQKPRPPILIAGAGPRMLRLAGREADIVGISPLGRKASGFEHFAPAMATSGDRIEDQIGWIRQGAGTRFEEIELSVFAHHLEITDDVTRTASDLAEEWGATQAQVLSSPHTFLGSWDRITESLIERRERYGLSYVVFSSLDIDDVIPAVSRLVGS